MAKDARHCHSARSVNAHKLETEFAEKVIEGTDQLRLANNQPNSVMRVITVALRTAGDDVRYEDLMGLSGAAFRLQFHQPNWCASSPHAMVGFNCVNPMIDALNYSVVLYKIDADDTKARDAAWQAVAKSIDGGCPVLYVTEEHGLVWGYQESGRRLWGRTGQTASKDRSPH